MYLHSVSPVVTDLVHGACMPDEWTHLVDRLAHRFREAGAAPGDRVLLRLPSDLRLAAALTALDRLEVTAVPVSALAPSAVVERLARETGARLAVGDVAWQSGCEPVFLPTPEPALCPGHENPAVILYTSGTTGAPRGVMLSRGALHYQAQTTAAVMGYRPDDRLYLPIPLWHSYGLSVMLAAFASGAALCLTSLQAPDRMVAYLRKQGCTSVDAVPALYASLLAYLQREPGAARNLSRSVRIWGVGGDKTAEGLMHRFSELTGRPLLDGYGLTEAGPNVAISTPETWQPGTVGCPMPGTEVRLAREAPGEPPELLVRSPSVMLGYWGRPAESATVLHDGWLRTGDLAEMDDRGRIRILGRRSGLIITAGANVSPAEVRDALLRLPDVREAEVLGLPHPRRGAVVTAFVATAGAPTSASNLRRELHGLLEPHKVPRRIVFLEQLPRNANGKVDKAQLITLATSGAKWGGEP
jgi:acyl-CoA synthetase (AMP-forming)/AMP-acid ligase II